MSVVGLSAQEQQNVLQLVAAILHLGNVSFVEDRSNFAEVQDERCNEEAIQWIPERALSFKSLFLFKNSFGFSGLLARNRSSGFKNQVDRSDIRKPPGTGEHDPQCWAGKLFFPSIPL